MRAGIAIDDWKLPIYLRRLSESGYVVEVGELLEGVSMLYIHTENTVALSEVIQSCEREISGGTLQ